MTDIFSDIEAAAEKEEEQLRKEVDLGLITKLVNRQLSLEEKANEDRVNKIMTLVDSIGASIGDIEEALKQRKKVLFNIRQIQIPEIMREFGLESITTLQGKKIEIKGDISVSVKNQERLFWYLRENDAGDLVKNQVIVDVSNEGERQEILELLERTACSFEAKESVHASTLKKYVKDCLEKGQKIPEDIVSTFEYQFSKIKK